MSTLFKKDPSNLGHVINEINPENSWVFTDKGVKATRKFDGTSCAIIGGKLYKRYDAKLDKSSGRAKPKRKIPDGAIECCPADMKSGHWPHWVPCHKDNPADKYHWEAWDKLSENNQFFKKDQLGFSGDGTYELCGPKVQGNPEGLEDHILIRHGSQELNMIGPDDTFGLVVYGNEAASWMFEDFKGFLEDQNIEGIVFHHPDNRPNDANNRYCKLRKSDFGLER